MDDNNIERARKIQFFGEAIFIDEGVPLIEEVRILELNQKHAFVEIDRTLQTGQRIDLTIHVHNSEVLKTFGMEDLSGPLPTTVKMRSEVTEVKNSSRPTEKSIVTVRFLGHFRFIQPPENAESRIR